MEECFIFRTKNWITWTVDFYAIAVPVDFGGHGNNTDVLFLKPLFLEPFLKTTKTTVPINSTFVSVGASLLCVGGFMNGKPLFEINRLAAAREDSCAEMMLSPRVGPNVVVMDGKLYIMGCQSLDGIWGECFDPCCKNSSPLPLPPSDGLLNTVVAPLHSSKKILVAPVFPSAPRDVAFVYRVEDKVWEILDHEIDFSKVCVHGEAAVLRNSTTLCWINRKTMMVQAYDLVLRKWFISPIEGLDKVGTLVGEPTPCSLFRLDDNHLCLLWQDYLGYSCYSPNSADCLMTLIHCTKVRVLISKGARVLLSKKKKKKKRGARGESIFNAFVVSSQSYVLAPGAKFVDGLAFGLGEDDDGRTEAVDITAPNRVPVQHSTGGSSSGGCGHDGRTHQGGNSSWGNGCFRCGEMEHKARDCNEGDQVMAGMLPNVAAVVVEGVVATLSSSVR